MNLSIAAWQTSLSARIVVERYRPKFVIGSLRISSKYTAMRRFLPQFLCFVSNHLFVVFALFFIFAFPLSLPSQGKKSTPAKMAANGTPPSAAEELNADAIQTRLSTIKDSKDFDDATKERIIGYYQRALDRLTAAAQWTTTAAASEQEAQEAPKLLEECKKALAQAPVEVRTQADKNAPLSSLEQNLAKAEADLTAAQNSLAELDAEPRRRSERRQEIPRLTAAAKSSIEEAVREMNAAPSEGESTEVVLARRLSAQAVKLAAEAEISAYEKESASYEARNELLSTRRDVAARSVSQAEKLVQDWREIVAASRQKEAENDMRRAFESRRAALGAHPSLREYFQRMADENAKLASERSAPGADEKPGVASRIDAGRRKLVDTNARLTALQDDFKKMKDRVKVAGLGEAVGLQFRSQRAKLPRIRLLERWSSARQEEIGEVELRIIELEESRNAIPDVEGEIKSVLKSKSGSIQTEQRGEIEKELRELLQTRQKLLDGLIADYRTLSETLVKLDAQNRELTRQVQAFVAYIEENILWIRSAPTFRPSDFRKSIDSFLWVADASQWSTVADGIRVDLLENPLLHLAVLVFLLIWISRGQVLRARITQIGEALAKRRGETMAQTWRAFVLTALIAGAWPTMLAFYGWRFITADTGELGSVIGAVMVSAAFLFAAVEFVRQTCRPFGLGESHFGWSVTALKVVRRHLTWLTAVGIPLSCGVRLLEGKEANAWNDPLGRIAFMAGMVTVAIYSHLLLKRHGGIPDDFYKRQTAGRPEWVQRVAYMLALSVPTALFLATGLGYYYTAATLSSRLIATAWLLICVLIAYAMASRWLLLIRGRLAIEQYRKRIAVTKAEGNTLEDAGTATLPGAEMDLTVISKQTRNLLRASCFVGIIIGMIVVWADVFPALTILNRVELWQTTVAQSPLPSAVQSTAAQALTEEKLAPITLGDLLLSIVFIVLTIIATTNLPGLLEIAVLQRFAVDPGVRYAFRALSAYVLSIIGIFAAFERIGIGWSDVQWLAAAITVGLGFGLQEIFANFVSGLIILFERPVRVGDIVTVGGVSGTVSRIKMRATTILDFDNLEMIVPNKDLITGQVVNWTLSSSITRVPIPIGIAYGSDTNQAQKILLEIARKNSYVLQQPEPKAIFMGFGDNALNFMLYVFLLKRQTYLEAVHALNSSIHEGLAQAGIEIAFPQRDIHIRSIQVPWPPSQHAPQK